ncbi:MAG: hypothetical protein QXE12_00335 [Conexivisphaerales archaeon]
MVDQLFLINSLLQLASGIVALSVSFTAFRYMKLVENDILRFLSFGFMLLGVGLVFGASLMLLLSFNIGRIAEDLELVYVATVAYLVLQALAYFSFAVGYARGAYGRVKEEVTSALFYLPTMALPRLPKSYLLLGTHINAALQLLILILLAFVIFQGALIYSRTKGRFSLLVLSGFCLIFIAHLIMLASSLIPSAQVFTAGAVVQFGGFLSLLVFLLNSGRVHAASKNPQ